MILPDPKPTPSTRRERQMRRRKRKRLHPEAYCVDCLQPPTHFGRCVSHATAWLDRAWGNRVRTGRCDLDRIHERHGIKCSGRIEACHILGRGFILTRWLRRNGISGCHAVNQVGEDDPNLWTQIAIEKIGRAEYDDLYRIAHTPADLDWDAARAEVGL